MLQGPPRYTGARGQWQSIAGSESQNCAISCSIREIISRMRQRVYLCSQGLLKRIILPNLVVSRIRRVNDVISTSPVRHLPFGSKAGAKFWQSRDGRRRLQICLLIRCWRLRGRHRLSNIQALVQRLVD